MATDPKDLKFSPRTWFSLILVGLLLVAVAVTQFATKESRDTRSQAANLALSSSVLCQSTNWVIKYTYTITDGGDTWLFVSRNSSMTDIVDSIHIGSSSGSVTMTPAFSNTTYYAQMNRYSYVGNKVSNSIGSLSCTNPSVTTFTANGVSGSLTVAYNSSVAIHLCIISCI